MKNSSLGLALVALFSQSPVYAQALEVPVARVFIPARGFDDNDLVQAVLDGELPNACYRIDRHSVDIDSTKKIISIKQFAVQLPGNICAAGRRPNDPILSPVPFTETVTLGRLPGGRYTLQIFGPRTVSQSRTFEVATALTPTLDSYPYAMVTEVSVRDVIVPGQKFQVQLNGILNNSCYELQPKVGVDVVDDVTILLPMLKVEQRGQCLLYTRPFSVNVDLQASRKEARYLVHVRSMNGKSLNRVYSVSKPLR